MNGSFFRFTRKIFCARGTKNFYFAQVSGANRLPPRLASPVRLAQSALSMQGSFRSIKY